eukprot:TRINITY_DN11799_c0_g1_i1.p1 TRINITY_DN11799_c0_g1~~TRINITY_DN11799_c0_g1_i1.p1  ORF type:complete len:420 (+),score=57.23 TRINITY_DN11799_c0_g1_i1:161-1420(+)
MLSPSHTFKPSAISALRKLWMFAIVVQLRADVCQDVGDPHRIKSQHRAVQRLNQTMYRAEFTPFAAIHALNSTKLEATDPYDEGRCQQALLSNHYYDAYYFNPGPNLCWLIRQPLHQSAGFVPTEPWPLSPTKPIVIQVRPARVARCLLQSLSSAVSSQQQSPQYRMLNNLLALTTTSRYMRIWLNYWYKAGGSFSQVLFIAQDVEFYNLIERLLPGQVLLEPGALANDAEDGSQAALFASPAFNNKMKRRYYQLAIIAATGVSLLYSDIDVFMLCNPLPEFARCNRMRAPFDESPYILCSGYIFVPAGDWESLRVLLATDAVFAATRSRLDQVNFNTANLVYSGVLLPLSFDRFPTARHVWKRVLSQGLETMAGKCYLHNNYAAAPKKMERLKQTGIIKHTIPDDHPGFVDARQSFST